MPDLFSLEGRVAVVTGGSGALGSTACLALAGAGAAVGVLARDTTRIEAVVAEIGAAGGDAFALPADVCDRAGLERASDLLLDRRGRLDVLVNAAGDNLREATVEPNGTFFDLPPGVFDAVFRLNAQSAVLASQVFGRALAHSDDEVTGRCIVNISSMAADRAHTRVAGYGAAKAAVENLTRWLAVDLARRFGDGLRVNAIAPGFVVSGQNRALLLEANGELTDRGRAVVDRRAARAARRSRHDPPLALQPRIAVRHRCRRPGRRWLQRLERNLTTSVGLLRDLCW